MEDISFVLMSSTSKVAKSGSSHGAAAVDDCGVAASPRDQEKQATAARRKTARSALGREGGGGGCTCGSPRCAWGRSREVGSGDRRRGHSRVLLFDIYTGKYLYTTSLILFYLIKKIVKEMEPITV